MLGPAVNRQPGFRRGLVEQSNAEKNIPVDWLAGSAADWLAAGWLVAAAADGWLAGWLLAAWLPGWLAAGTCCCWLADCAATAGWLADRLAKWPAAAAGQLGWLLPAGRY